MRRRPPSALRPSIATATAVGSLLLFLVIRGVFAFVRQPFFDELFTVWISRRSFTDLFEAIRFDSGPPLYYLLVDLLFRIAPSSVDVARTLSLVLASASLIAILWWKELGPSRFVAAILLAVLPASFYFSTEARAYALCSMAAGFAVLALERWLRASDRRALVCAAVLLVVAAYAHYYGVLLFGVPVVLAILGGRWRGLTPEERRARLTMLAEGAGASALAGLLFIPGFLLASSQPAADATRWMVGGGEISLGAIEQSGLVFWRLGFAGPFPDLFLPVLPDWMQWLSLVLTATVLLIGTRKSRGGIVFAVATIVPVLGLAALTAAGRSVYFPLRFESVLAVPFVLWLSVALERFPRAIRGIVLGVLVASGLLVCLSAIVVRSRALPGPYASVAAYARAQIPPGETLVVSGYSYLEVASRTDRRWSPPLRAFPIEQGRHPGWRAEADPGELRSEMTAISRRIGGQFYWIGDVGSPEFKALLDAHRILPLYRDGPAIVVRTVDQAQ